MLISIQNRMVPAVIPSVILAFQLLTSSGGAQPHGGFGTVGVGSASCATWTTVRQSHSASDYEQWILGFLSGVSHMALGELSPARAMDAEGIWSWTDGYCQAHAEHDIARAASAFMAAHPR
jgi:hypothetical protein